MRGFLVSVISLMIFSTTAVLLWLREKKRVDEISGELESYYSKLKERRKTIRFDKKLNVVCRVIEKNNSKWSAFTKDVSGEGICLVLPEMLPEDATVDLVIEIPQKEKVSITGKAVWIKEISAAAKDGKRQFSAGIKFVKIKPKDRDNLMSFVSSFPDAK